MRDVQQSRSFTSAVGAPVLTELRAATTVPALGEILRDAGRDTQLKHIARGFAVAATITAALVTGIGSASAGPVQTGAQVFTSSSHCPAGYHEIIVGAKYTGDLVYVCYN